MCLARFTQACLGVQVDYTKFALFFNHTEPHWLAEVKGGVQWELDPDGPHPNHPTDAHWCGPAAAFVMVLKTGP